ALDFLNRAMEEIAITNFKHKGPKLINDQEKRRELYRENNARNKDLYSKQKLNNKLIGLDTLEASKNKGKVNHEYKNTTDDLSGTNNTEDAMLLRLELRKLGIFDE